MEASTKYVTVECCIDCASHQFDTRHVEAKYVACLEQLTKELEKTIPGIQVLKNAIPKTWVDYHLYKNLIHNSDESCPIYEMLPELGAFEISTEGKLLWSKRQSGRWPNAADISTRVDQLLKAKEDQPHLLFDKNNLKRPKS